MKGFKDDFPLQLANVNLTGCFPQLSLHVFEATFRQATEEAQDANTEPKLETLDLIIPNLRRPTKSER